MGMTSVRLSKVIGPQPACTTTSPRLNCDPAGSSACSTTLSSQPRKVKSPKPLPSTIGSVSVYVPGCRQTLTGPRLASPDTSVGSVAPPATSPGPTVTVQPQLFAPVSVTRLSNGGTQPATVASPCSHVTTASGHTQVRGPSGGCGASR